MEGLDHFKTILATARRKFPGFQKNMKEAEAISRWPQAVGPAIAKYSRAAILKGGILWVEVDHPIWRAELHHRKNQILKVLNGDGTELIKDIFFIDPKTTSVPFESKR